MCVYQYPIKKRSGHVCHAPHRVSGGQTDRHVDRHEYVSCDVIILHAFCQPLDAKPPWICLRMRYSIHTGEKVC